MKQEENPQELTFWDHLDELRNTLFRIAIAVVVLMLLAFCFKDELFGIILAPKESDFYIYRLFDWLGNTLHIPGIETGDFDVRLINTKLSGQFMMHMSISFYAGIILASPYIIYKLFRFVSPALYENERRYSLRVVSWGYLLFLTGVVFSYFIIFPFTFRFLATYQVSADVENTIMLSSYVDTLAMLSLMMGILFEIPILAWLFAKLGFLTADFMRNYRKHAIVVALVVAAVITPTSDAFTLLLVTLPIVALYEASILIVSRTNRKRVTAAVAVLLLLLAGNPAPASAAHTEPISFSHLSIDDGLSQNTIFSITQDFKGNLWFATYDGINKYDGYDFTVYRHVPSDTTSIASDIIHTIMTDDSGRIWIGTEKGLSFYNEKKDVFENYPLIGRKEVNVRNIIQYSDSRLLISADSRLYFFDINTHTYTRQGIPGRLMSVFASALHQADHTIYIGTANSGVLAWEERQGKPVVSSIGTENIQHVQALLRQGPTRLWVGTEGGGLYLVNLQTGEQKHYLHTSSAPGCISSNYIRALSLSARGQLWIGTFNDLNIYDEGSDTFYSYTHDPVNAESLSQRSVRCIYKDSQGGMWLGTYFGGLNYYHPLKNRFKNIRRIPYKHTLSDNVISCMVEDRKGNIWVGTNDGGITLYNPVDDTYRYYAFNHDVQTPTSESNNIKSIYIDEKRDLVYIGTHAGGLKILHRSTGQIEHYPGGNAASVPPNIYSIIPRTDNELWIGSLDGLFLFRKDSKTFIPVQYDISHAEISSQNIYMLFEDSRHRLWIGGKKSMGLYRVTPQGLSKLSLPDKAMEAISQVQDFHEDADRSVWIGTRYGLYRWNDEKKELTHYTTADGLPSNVIYGIEEDSYHSVWVSTNHGLSCLNGSTKTFRNFSVNDGLQSNQFNMYAHCRTADGEMYFGGINGITTFRPELLSDNPFTPKPFITKLYLYNKEVHPDDGTGILKDNISDTESITFAPSQRAFTLGFVVPNFISGENTFAYKLEGFDSEWYYQTDKRSASYSNLPAGKYRFLVKAANSDGKWCEEPTVLEIIVQPTWYNTWWARLLFFIVCASVFGLIVRYLWERKTMEARLALEHQDKLHQEEMAQMKMRFFINISHELRTPLTLILAPLQDMLARTTDRWMREQLNYVSRNANRLLNLVNQLMDYRRAELGVFKLKVEPLNVYRCVKDTFSFYEKLARHKGLAYTFTSDVEEQTFHADPKYIELILNNLLSNAFKYTDAGSIGVRLTRQDNDLLLEVSDTGSGIATDKHKRIFDRFYQLENSHVGSGIGLSLVQRLVELHHGRIDLQSTVGKGSTFTVWLPQDPSVYKADEWQKTADEEDDREVHSTNPQEMYFIDTEKNETAALPGEETKRGNVLVVEDNEEIRRYLHKGLSATFSVEEATNGAEALEKLKDMEADIVITDVMMPVMDGIKLCKQIKQNIGTSHIFVIMLSAKVDITDQMEAMQTGADDYIPKPFTMSLLVSKIKNLMRTRIRMQEFYAKSTKIEPEKITFNAMDEELLRRAMDVVRNNMDNPDFSTEEFARSMNMSRSNLHLKLKAITGESAIEFIRKIRLDEACRLLREGRYNISEISERVGFKTPSYFSNIFKKYMGCLPTEYVRKGNA